MKTAIKVVSIIEFIGTLLSLLIGMIYVIFLAVSPAIILNSVAGVAEEELTEIIGIFTAYSALILILCIPAMLFSLAMVIVVFCNMMKTVNNNEKRVVWGVLSIIFFSIPSGILYLCWNGR